MSDTIKTQLKQVILSTKDKSLELKSLMDNSKTKPKKAFYRKKLVKNNKELANFLRLFEELETK